jgi:quercetin dioxygenase-like cupin family protein
MKRVVTGNNQDGKSVFVSTGEPPRIVTSTYGNQLTYCWTTPGIPVVPGSSGDDPTLTMTSNFPAPGGTSFFLVEFPGNAETRMHTTDTVDYGTVLSGEIWLILDDGAEVHLTPGDCVVQNGTQHAWHNRTSEPCVMVGVTVGAERQQ